MGQAGKLVGILRTIPDIPELRRVITASRRDEEHADRGPAPLAALLGPIVHTLASLIKNIPSCSDVDLAHASRDPVGQIALVNYATARARWRGGDELDHTPRAATWTAAAPRRPPRSRWRRGWPACRCPRRSCHLDRCGAEAAAWITWRRARAARSMRCRARRPRQHDEPAVRRMCYMKCYLSSGLRSLTDLGGMPLPIRTIVFDFLPPFFRFHRDTCCNTKMDIRVQTTNAIVVV